MSTVYLGATQVLPGFRWDGLSGYGRLYLGDLEIGGVTFGEHDVYSIAFTGDWTPSEKFNQVFELCNASGTNTYPTATSATKYYKFKDANTSWSALLGDASGMFSSATTLSSICLPHEWDSIYNVESMFSGCTALGTVTLPVSWGDVVNCTQMFKGCSAIRDIRLPQRWNDVSDTTEMFSGCSALCSIGVPVLGSISTKTDMFIGTLFHCVCAGTSNVGDYYFSRFDGEFPTEVYVSGIGLDLSWEHLAGVRLTGSQYFDTGVNAKSGLVSDMLVRFPVSSLGSCLLGAKTTNFIFSMASVTEDNLFSIGYGIEEVSERSVDTGVKTELKSVLLPSNQDLWVNNEQVIIKFERDSFDLNTTLFLGAMNTGSGATKHTNFEFYYGELSLNDEMVKQYWPAKRLSDSMFGIWDRVNDSFVAPVGTGILEVESWD